MNNIDLDLIRGTDKFLRLHIDDLSKLTLNERTNTNFRRDPSMAAVVISAALIGFAIGVIAAHCLGLLP
ncbi:hypothetical protein UFOVP612_38 [uncultured Caudovirales phage]|uniref:Uncharacterized protein n=1 Tax=uncultured Caudovirales phage TaxID=2100421 RepID=A0A6J5N7C3_9CAUD|nr:hypothetical protein UFOVP612_38 [uncultured Caudovirales phage]